MRVKVCPCSCACVCVCATICAVETAVQVSSWLLDEFSEESYPSYPTVPPPLSHSLLYYRALSKWQSAFVQPFEILVTFLSDAQPNNKGAFMLRSRLGKRHRQNFGGKRPRFVPSGHAVDYQKSRIFVSSSPALFVCVCLCGGHSCLRFPVLKRKKIQFVSTHGPSGYGLVPAIFGKILMQASVGTECTSLFCQEVLLSGVDNASGQYLDYATLKLCRNHY